MSVMQVPEVRTKAGLVHDAEGHRVNLLGELRPGYSPVGGDLVQVVGTGVGGTRKGLTARDVGDEGVEVHGSESYILLDSKQAFSLPPVGDSPPRLTGMRPIDQVRRQRLAALVEEAGGQSALAAKIGKDKNQIYQWLADTSEAQSRNIGTRSARAVEEAMGRPEGWLDRDDALGAESQLRRPDPAILAQTQEFLDTAYAFQGKRFEMARDADLFADAYEWLAEDDRPVDRRNLVDFGRWMAGRQPRAQGEHDEQRNFTTGQAASPNRRRAG